MTLSLRRHVLLRRSSTGQGGVNNNGGVAMQAPTGHIHGPVEFPPTVVLLCAARHPGHGGGILVGGEGPLRGFPSGPLLSSGSAHAGTDNNGIFDKTCRDCDT